MIQNDPLSLTYFDRITIISLSHSLAKQGSYYHSSFLFISPFTDLQAAQKDLTWSTCSLSGSLSLSHSFCVCLSQQSVSLFRGNWCMWDHVVLQHQSRSCQKTGKESRKCWSKERKEAGEDRWMLERDLLV